jgi:endonuclease YncB( thermonuclease family)
LVNREGVAFGLLALFLISGCATPAWKEPASAPSESEAPSAAPPTLAPVRVAAVIDGDTIELANGKRVRLVQIDAPESSGECYGRKAGTVLRRLLPVGAEVRLVRDRRLDNVDRYGRLLRYVFRGRKNVNLLLVEQGAASAWFFDGDRGRYAAKLARAVGEARSEGRGAWGACEASFDFSRAWTVRENAPPAPPPPTTASNCHPSYEGACLDPGSSDYDCAGGSGNGPDYTGPVRVVGPDDFGLDADGDGVGCET